MNRSIRLGSENIVQRTLAGLTLGCSLLVWNAAVYARHFVSTLELTETLRSFQSPSSQGEIRELKLGEPLSREIPSGGGGVFKISVPAKQYFHIIVEQKGIVLAAELLRAGGQSVVKVENVAGAYGPLHIYEIANTAGDYRLEVRSTEHWARGGPYEIRLQEFRAAVTADEARVTAQRTFTEGQDLLSRAREQSGDEANKSRNSAIDKFKAAAQHWRELADPYGEATSLYLIGVTYQRGLGRSQDAKQFILQALALAPQLAANEWRLEASLWNDLGVVYDALYDEKNARNALENALRIFDAHNDLRGRASTNNNLGLVHARSGQASEAIKAYQVALSIRQADNDKENEIITLNNIGGAYETLGEPRQALAFYEAALKGWKEGKENSRIGIGLNNVARASDTLGLWQQALDYYKEALELVQKQGNRRLEATFLYNIGGLYSRLNDSSRALENYEKSLVIHQEIKNFRDEANVRAHIAEIQFTLGKAEQALESYTRAMQILENNRQVESRRVQAYILIRIANLYLTRDFAKALEHAEKARKLSQEAGDLQQEADALDKIGEAYTGLGQNEKALDSFSSALLLRRKLEDRLGEALTLFNIASLKSNVGQLNDAAKILEDTLKIVESLRGNLVSRQLRTSYFEKTQNYYELYIDVKMRLYQANHDSIHREQALAASERKRARALIDSLLEANADIRQGVAANLLAESKDNEEKLRSKARLKEQLLNELEVNQKLLEQQSTPPTIRRVKELKQRVSNVSKDIADLINQSDDIQTRIKSSSPNFAALNNLPSFSLKELQQLLSDDTIFLQYSLGENRSYIWAIKKNDIQSFELPRSATIEGVVRKLFGALTARARRDKTETISQKEIRIRNADIEYLLASAELARMVLGPVAPLLNHQKRLIVVADGALQLVPFAVLPDPQQVTQSPTLITNHEIVNVPSASVLALQRRELANRKSAPLRVAVVADPVFDADDARLVELTSKTKGSKRNGTKMPDSDQPPPVAVATPSMTSTSDAVLQNALRDVGLNPDVLGRLPFSRDEADKVSSLVPANQSLVALNFRASRSIVTSGELAKYRNVHFATHGILDLEHPELSGIVLSRFNEKGQPQDGYLRLYEIYNLKLPAELVVLSACQTGTGRQIRGEGLIALTRGFMYAGAERVVASLWKVDDAATAELMARFYKEMFTNGKRPAAALREAQLSLSKERRWRSPFYWAGFVLQGEWK